MVESIKELREICYKDSKGRRPLYMEWVTMKISIFVTKLLLYTPIKADQVTIGMVLLAILGSVFMAFGTLKFLLIGILIIHFTVILEILNKYYWNALPQYAMLYWYLVIYGSVSVLIQLISFIVHYKGNTIYHYYVAMLGKGKK